MLNVSGPLSAGPLPDFAEKVRLQLNEYFAGTRKNFDVLLRPNGTPFQKRVWAQLQQIPYGSTVSYGELARRIGQPKASRAVGQANNRNPIPVMIPCHRVIGSSGKLTGYACGLNVKRRLLMLEQALPEKELS